MVSFNNVQAQLVKTNSQSTTINVEDVKSLAHILEDSEQIVTCLKGTLNDRPALLCATDIRLLLVDVKSKSSTIREVAYETINDMTHHEKTWSSYIAIITDDSRYQFRSWRKRQSKDAHAYIVRHISYVKNTLRPETVFTLPQKLAHYTRPKSSMRVLGNTAIVEQ